MRQDSSDVRIIICGSRVWGDVEIVHHILQKLVHQHGSRLVIIHGGASRGTDMIAHRYCQEHGVREEVHPADWTRHGKRAGHMRNQKMADSGAEGCVAFNASTRGTQSMIEKALAAGITVLEVVPDRTKRIHTPGGPAKRSV